MGGCEYQISRIDWYLDYELHGEELKAFTRHINECSSCRQELTERGGFLDQVRATRPLYLASAEFRTQMAALLAQLPVRHTKVNPRQHIGARVPTFPLWLRCKFIPALMASVLAVVGIATLWRFSFTEARANAFVDMAVASHRNQEAGHLPLQVRANSPKKIRAWFEGKVPFHFRFPDSQETAG